MTTSTAVEVCKKPSYRMWVNCAMPNEATTALAEIELYLRFARQLPCFAGIHALHYRNTPDFKGVVVAVDIYGHTASPMISALLPLVSRFKDMKVNYLEADNA